MTNILPAPPAFTWEPLPAFHALLGREGAALAECRGRRIGILVLASNAARTLAQLLHRIPPQVWSNTEEVAVFDDASADATYEVATRLCSQLPKLTVRKNDRNLGYGGIRKAGCRYFLDRGFDILVLLPGGGQYPPELLARFYHPIILGDADAVFGSRMIPIAGSPLSSRMPLDRYAGNRILSALESSALGLHLSEFHCGYRAYNLHALRHIDLTRMTDDFDFDTEIIIKLRHQGYSIREVPIPGSPSEMDSVQGWKCAGRVIRAMRRYRQTCRSLACHPEFQEYYVHYPLKAARYSSHDYACRMTGSGHDVLDVGCGEGFLAAELARNCNRVTGIDCRPRPRREASLERYWRLDLDRDSLAGRLRGQRFDRILLLDVLEHLLHPERVLKECRPLLRPDGAAIISLPNIANLAIRLGLLFGHFDYTERGILDRGHVRFFTRKTARRLVEENGYEIVEEKFTVIPLDLALGLRSNARLHRSLSRGLAALTRLFPGLLGYQIVLLARPRPAPVS